jgi:hypothetical protein
VRNKIKNRQKVQDLSKEKRGKKTSNGRHNTTEKTKDVERTSLKTEMNSGAPERYIESNTGKSARQGKVSEISLSCTFCRFLILFLTFIIPL